MSNEVGFVTKRFLVSLSQRIAIPYNGTVVDTPVFIAELTEHKGKVRNNAEFTWDTNSFRIVGLSDGKKLTKSINVHIPGYHTITSLVELENDELV